MIRKWFVAALAVALVSVGPSVPRVMAAPMPPQGYGGQQGGWDVPPREFNEVQRLGFHDGIEGARKDFGNHRSPTPDNREEYRSPHVAYELRGAYRAAFRRGYEVAASHLWAEERPAPVGPQPEPGGDWEWGARGLRSDAERQGFHEGAEHARRDFSEHRRPDPDDHREFRNPPVGPAFVEDYRQGFMRGYEVAMSQLSGEGRWEGRGDPDRWMPQRFSELQRRGFHDGIDGANKDFGNHRNPNPANREEYRSPHLPPNMWNEYREGFRRGYEMTAMRLWGDRY